ncbi:MAG: hypothetical protein KME30_29055 [Iphinoe sp. HA4291-MV1]|jgi:hypothetical protein|nr:hypothetical protein [Iphinoe sp. HA4291-MV1]
MTEKRIGKRNNPKYSQMLVYVSKELSVKFKTLLASKELEQSEVVEQLIERWIEEQEQNK